MDLNISFEAERRYCLHCQKPLQPINSLRKNGKQHRHDREDRKYHKRCWKVIEQVRETNRTFESLGMSERITRNDAGEYSMTNEERNKREMLINTWTMKHGNADGFDWAIDKEN